MGPGDIVTHAFTGFNPGGLVGDGGRVLPGALDARRRGVRFDVGHGAGSFAWATAEAALADGFLPDTISTDLHRFNIASPVGDLPATMSKLLHLGVPLDDVVAMVTSAAVASLGPARAGLGRLAIGDEADLTVLGIEEERRLLLDAKGVGREVDRHLVPAAVLRGGVRVAVEPRVTVAPAGIAPG